MDMNNFNKPASVRLEASTLCQLRCPDCYMRKGNYCELKAGYLTFENFKKFLELNPYVGRIELSNSGEIFLNPDLKKIIELAAQKNIALSAVNGVNFNTVSDEMLETLVKYKFQILGISLDGASQETYAQYRVNGNFDRVIANIRKLNDYKKQYSSEFPRLIWSYIIFEHNDTETEICRAMELSKSLEMEPAFRNAWNGYKTKHAEIITNQGYRTGIYDRQTDKELLLCSLLWNLPQINWDGRLYGCCCNFWKPYNTANAFSVELEKILTSHAVVATKQMLMGKGTDRNSPCLSCGHYKTMQAKGQVIDENLELKFSPKVFVVANLKGVLRRLRKS
jgi:hypothetical protein